MRKRGLFLLITGSRVQVPAVTARGRPGRLSIRGRPPWALIQFGRLTYQAGELAMNYDDQWQSLRRRSRLWWCLFLGLIPTIILVGFAMDLVSPGLAARSDPSIFFGAWMVAFLTATIYWGEFRCPRCGKRFFRTRLGGVNGFARHCPHCGLRKWSSNEPASN